MTPTGRRFIQGEAGTNEPFVEVQQGDPAYENAPFEEIIEPVPYGTARHHWVNSPETYWGGEPDFEQIPPDCFYPEAPTGWRHWYWRIGSMPPREGEDHEEHVERVTLEAWNLALQSVTNQQDT